MVQWNSQTIPRLYVEVNDLVLQLDHDGTKLNLAKRPAPKTKAAKAVNKARTSTKTALPTPVPPLEMPIIGTKDCKASCMATTPLSEGLGAPTVEGRGAS